MKLQKQIYQIDDLCLYHLQKTINDWAKESIVGDKEIRIKKQSRIHGALAVLRMIDEIDVIVIRSKNHIIKEIKIERLKETKHGRNRS